MTCRLLTTTQLSEKLGFTKVESFYRTRTKLEGEGLALSR